MSIFKLPDLGEGLPEAEIVEWHVKEGDVVKTDQLLVSMETAKAVVEVPSPNDGKITKLHGTAGDTILTGSPLVEFEDQQKAEIRDTGTVAGKIESTDTILEEDVIIGSKAKASAGIKATPAIRAMAKKLGVDINSVTPTGPNGTLTTQDLQDAASKLNDIGELLPLKGVRKAMAQAMVKSHKDVVPVTICDDAKLINWTDKEDITIRIIQAIVAGIKQEPALNCWFDGDALARRLISSIDLGIAMDSNDGLFVPVIKDTASKSSSELRNELNALKKGVLDRTIAQDKLKSPTITLSNFGKFAGRYANPVIVPPQVAILGVGAIREEAVVVNNEVKISKVMPLALTFDHRALTGGEATRFLGKVIEELSM